MVVFLLGCSTVTMSERIDDINDVYLGEVGNGVGRTDVHRFIDTEYNVVCWVTNGLREGGISCIPLEDLT